MVITIEPWEVVFIASSAWACWRGLPVRLRLKKGDKELVIEPLNEAIGSDKDDTKDCLTNPGPKTSVV